MGKLGYGLRKRCKVTNKIRYDSEDDANKAAVATQKSNISRHGEYDYLHSFYCIHCRNWHVGHE